MILEAGLLQTEAPEGSKLMEHASAAYRLAVCCLGAEAGAEDVVLEAYRKTFAAMRRGVIQDGRILLLREVIRGARRHLAELERLKKQQAIERTDVISLAHTD